MTPSCSYCRGPLPGDGLKGRFRPGCDCREYCCYGCLTLGEDEVSGARAASDRELGGLAWKLGLGVLLAGQSMLLGMGINLAPPDEPQLLFILQSLVLVCTLIVLAVLGGPLFRGVLSGLGRGRVGVESLFVVTLIGAFGASMQSLILGEGPIYFETVSILLVVYTIGKLVGARGRASALARSQAWNTELSRSRLVDELGRTHEVDTSTIRPGDIVEIRPGEMIPVDGVIAHGVGFVCEATRTGEPFPVVRRPGDHVLAGCAAEDAAFQVRAVAAGTERQVDRFLELVEEARTSRTSLQNQADRLARVFLPVLMSAAALTFAFWTWHDGWRIGLFNAMSVLLVACPCALGLATPIVLWSALGRLAERGLLTRHGDLIERLAAVDRVVLDKTGTLTEEHHVLVDLVVVEGEDRAVVLRRLAAVEQRSSHPMARAFASIVPREESDRVRIVSLRVVPGRGLDAEVEDDGRHILRVGRFGESSGGLRIDVEMDGRPVAAATMAEHLRGSATAALHDFADLGLGVEVMTGDASGRKVEGLESLPLAGSLTPERKQLLIQRMIDSGERPLFLGDGINDAAALATATAGIALASGTDLAVGASSATLYGGDLRVVPWAIALSREAVRTARTTMVWAAAYNLLGMTTAALGLLHPIAAALLMAFSSAWVSWLSSRLGSATVSCHAPRAALRIGWKTAVHALCLALQGPLLVSLLGLSFPAGAALSLGLLLAAALLSLVWQAWEGLPHGIDMLFGMLTLGNLGMLAGWWLDLGFGSIDVACPCGCGGLFAGGLRWSALTGHAGMWIGMFLCGNLALVRMTRTPCPLAARRLVRFVTGNVGMAVGMLAGSASAEFLAPYLSMSAAFVHVSAMSVGMMAGMTLVHLLRARENPSPSVDRDVV